MVPVPVLELWDLGGMHGRGWGDTGMWVEKWSTHWQRWKPLETRRRPAGDFLMAGGCGSRWKTEEDDDEAAKKEELAVPK